jgi:hypothetical protein
LNFCQTAINDLVPSCMVGRKQQIGLDAAGTVITLLERLCVS